MCFVQNCGDCPEEAGPPKDFMEQLLDMMSRPVDPDAKGCFHSPLQVPSEENE